MLFYCRFGLHNLWVRLASEKTTVAATSDVRTEGITTESVPSVKVDASDYGGKQASEKTTVAATDDTLTAGVSTECVLSVKVDASDSDCQQASDKTTVAGTDDALTEGLTDSVQNVEVVGKDNLPVGYIKGK